MEIFRNDVVVTTMNGIRDSIPSMRENETTSN
jgi:hypothetical protein